MAFFYQLRQRLDVDAVQILRDKQREIDALREVRERLGGALGRIHTFLAFRFSS